MLNILYVIMTIVLALGLMVAFSLALEAYAQYYGGKYKFACFSAGLAVAMAINVIYIFIRVANIVFM